MAKKTTKKAPSPKAKAPTTDPKIRCSFTKMLPISKIRPHPSNPNQHTPEQIHRFAEILKFQGTRRPFRISKRSNFLTVGHGMLEAYKINGWLEGPVDYQEYDDEAQEYADLVADNSLATWAQMDLSVISEQIQKLGVTFNADMLGIDGFAFDPEAIAFPEDRSSSERTKDERTDEYMASQSRNIILVYSLPEFSRVTGLLAEIMKLRSFETFSDAVSAMLEEYANDLRKANGSRRKDVLPKTT